MGPPCRAACPPPGTRGGRGAGGRRWGGHPARTRPAHGRRGTSPAALQQGLGVGLVHLADGRLRLVQQVSGSGHVRTSGSHQTVRTAGIEPLNTTSGVNIPGDVHWARWAPAGDSPAMELHEAIRRRSMVRSFSRTSPSAPTPSTTILLPPCAPPRPATPGARRGSSCEGPAQTARVLRGHHRRGVAGGASRPLRWPLAGHPVVLLAYASPVAYVGALPRARQGLASGPRRGSARPGPSPTGSATPHSGSWPRSWQPVDAGLGACVLGTLPGRGRPGTRLGRAPPMAPVLRVALGRPDGGDHRSPSLERSGPAATRTASTGADGSEPVLRPCRADGKTQPVGLGVRRCLEEIAEQMNQEIRLCPPLARRTTRRVDLRPRERWSVGQSSEFLASDLSRQDVGEPSRENQEPQIRNPNSRQSPQLSTLRRVASSA